MPSTQPTFPFTVQARTGSIIILSACFSHECGDGCAFRMLVLQAIHRDDIRIREVDRYLPFITIVDASTEEHVRTAFSRAGISDVDTSLVITAAEYCTTRQIAACNQLFAATAHSPAEAPR